MLSPTAAKGNPLPGPSPAVAHLSSFTGESGDAGGTLFFHLEDEEVEVEVELEENI